MDRGGFVRASERVVLDAFPDEVLGEDLVDCFTLSAEDLDFVMARRDRSGRVLAGLQIGALRLMGLIPEGLEAAPAEVISFVADQVGVDPGEFVGFDVDRVTRWRSRASVETHLGFRQADSGDLKRLSDWLGDRAVEHDQPWALYRSGCSWLRSEKVIRVGSSVLERAVMAARQRATERTYMVLASQLDHDARNTLDRLLAVTDGETKCVLTVLRRSPTGRVAAQIGCLVDRLEVLRSVGGDRFDMSGLNPNRVRFLAGLGRRMSPSAIARLAPERRYQILVATVVDATTRTIDQILDLFDTAVTAAIRPPEDRAGGTVDRQRSTVRVADAFSVICELVLDSDVADVDLRAAILAAVTASELAELGTEAADLAASGTGFDAVMARRYRTARQFGPKVLEALTFDGPSTSSELLDAICVLNNLNRTGARVVPVDTPVGFVRGRFKHTLYRPDGSIDRHCWELALLTEIRGALRGGDLWVKGSDRYQNPARFLLPEDRWGRDRQDHSVETGIGTDATERLSNLGEVINRHLAAVDEALDAESIVRIENDRLVVTPLPAEDTPASVDALRSGLEALIPEVDLVDVLVEVNAWCGYLDELTHASGAVRAQRNHQARLMAALVAEGCNIGVAPMARASEFARTELAWTKQWHLRTETIRAANNRIVNHQADQPITQIWGAGTLSSSDGQRFPMIKTSPRARSLRRYFTSTGATIYTWTSDQHSQYGTRVIPTTVREATDVLDAIFDNETNLDIEEHTTDTAGYTDLVFGLFDLCGLRFSPRIRDLADQRLWRFPATPVGTPAAGLLKHRVNIDRIVNRFDDMCRVAATIRSGHVPASVLIARLQGSSRTNELTKAIQEYGRIIKTISILRYLHDPDHRRRVGRQLNKGESLHGLRGKIHFGNESVIQTPDPDQQDLQAESLTLLTNAIICWNTIYLQHALSSLDTDPEALTHIAPTSYSHINLYGRYDFTTPSPPPTGTFRPLTAA
ncbi:MAG: Tn3 family transposase [bacterium]|nr:Tn3 family transposase [bacterium]